jgi:hypothetical protein
MASNNELRSLDKRIEENLMEIYENEIVPLKKIIEFVEQYKNFKLSGAEKLEVLFSNNKKDNNSGQPKEVISTHGLPGFFAGDRDAKTVMLMLNPGQDVALANNPITTYDRLKKGDGKDYNISSLSFKDFVDIFKDNSKNYGNIDKDRADNFDLKQAAFLKHWDGWSDNVDNRFAGFLDSDYKKMLKGKIDDETKKTINDINKKAKQIVLMQKLSMDLVPYASRKFEGISPKKMELLFPYLETLFHEIFEKDRKYVIFCSNFYEDLFKRYNKWNERKWHIERLSGPKEKDENVLNNSKVYCRPIIIKYRKEEEIKYRQEKKLNCSQNAIIAHTFPNKSLPNAYEKMEKYGKFCYEEWNKAFGTDE